MAISSRSGAVHRREQLGRAIPSWRLPVALAQRIGASSQEELLGLSDFQSFWRSASVRAVRKIYSVFRDFQSLWRSASARAVRYDYSVLAISDCSGAARRRE